MKNLKDDISVINHNLRNNIGVAISYMQLIQLDQSSMLENTYFKAASEDLKGAIELTTEISLLCKNEVNSEDAVTDNNLPKIEVKAQLFEHAKAVYEKFRKRYTLNISDVYKEIDEEKYIAINDVSLNKVRDNFITNAINANATKIDFLYEMKEYCLVVTIQDNGKGMSQDELDQLMLGQIGDGILHGIGTRSILKTMNEHGFTIAYSSVKGEGTKVRVLCNYVLV